MISSPQKKKLKRFLKVDYVEDVLKKLKYSNIVSRNGTAYGESTVRNVFNGTLENKRIEEAILLVFIDRKTAHKILERTKKQLLSA